MSINGPIDLPVIETIIIALQNSMDIESCFFIIFIFINLYGVSISFNVTVYLSEPLFIHLAYSDSNCRYSRLHSILGVGCLQM